jgi:hypothetical protein
VIESALSIIIAGLFGYWHVLYSWVIGLSVVTAVFFLRSHRDLLPTAQPPGHRADFVPSLWTHFMTVVLFMSISLVFLAVHFAVYFLVSWVH